MAHCTYNPLLTVHNFALHCTDTRDELIDKMSSQKKRKVDSKCGVFNKEWTTKYFFTEVRSKAVCLICKESIAVLKEHNISRHFSTGHANYASKLSSQDRATTATKLAAS